MKKFLPVIIGVALVVGGGAFYGGMKYAQAKAPTRTFQRSFNGGQGGGMGFRGGAGGGMMGFLSGDILSNDGKTLTIKGRDGSSKIVLLSDTTDIMVSVAGKASDLEVGKTVMVQGKPNSDGSITAQSVQVRPPMPAPANGQTAPAQP